MNVEEKLNEKVKVSTYIVQKVTGPGTKHLHNKHMQLLVQALMDFGVGPFSGPVKEISTGKRSRVYW